MFASARPYGPNTDAVRRLLQRLAALPPDRWTRIARLYEGLQRTPRFVAADRVLGEAMTAAGREGERDAVVGPVVQIATDAAERAGRATSGADGGVQSGEVDRYAEPALAAALAVVARDLIGRDEFETLYGAVSWGVPEAELGR